MNDKQNIGILKSKDIRKKDKKFLAYFDAFIYHLYEPIKIF